MGKKQKNANNEQRKAVINNGEEVKAKQIMKGSQSEAPVKMSKKEKRRLKNQMRQSSKEQVDNNAIDIQQEDKQQQVSQVQQEQIVEQIISEEIQDLISINSSQPAEQIQQVQLNTRGAQGFSQLIQQQNSNQQFHQKSKYLEIKRTLTEGQKQQTYFMYHLKKQQFYRVVSLSHEKKNLTHVNEAVSIGIVDEALLKEGSNQVSSTAFEVNGKIIEKRVEFIKSTVLRVIDSKNERSQSKNKKNSSKDKKNNSKVDKIKQNVLKFIKPSTAQITSQILQFLRDFQWSSQCLLISKQQLIFTPTNAPFSTLGQTLLKSNNSLLILGKKNTGKSTLSEYIKNIAPNSTCILDCDIGRSLTISGCVSLVTSEQTINLWVGEFTPLNCIRAYLKSIQKLYEIYRQKYFMKKLIINTMGYLTGLGEMILYEIYNLINPKEIVVINAEQDSIKSKDNSIAGILHHIRTGSYLSRLLLNENEEFLVEQIRKFSQKKLQLNVHHLKNQHAQSKGIPVRFENLLLYRKNSKNIVELIKSIYKKQLNCVSNLKLFDQDRLGKLTELNSDQREQVNMRIVLIGRLIQDQNMSAQNKEFIQVYGIGYGFEGKVYFSLDQIQNVLTPNIDLKAEKQDLVGIMSQGVDFEKNFYLINEPTLIDFELEYGRIPYIMPIVKSMGSKGTRNTPSKSLTA